jgi:type II secretory pathway component PulF
VSAAIGLIAGWLSLRQPRVRASLISQFSRLPFIRTLFNFYRSGLFCRNLGILLGGGVNLTARTFTAQVEALQRCRSVNDKNITVQNVSIRDSAQAILGNVTHNS